MELLIAQLDAQSPAVDVRFVPVKEAEATQLATAVTQLIHNRDAYRWGNAEASGVSLTADERSNQLVVIAPPSRMSEVLDLIAGLDASPQLQRASTGSKVLPQIE